MKQREMSIMLKAIDAFSVIACIVAAFLIMPTARSIYGLSDEMYAGYLVFCVLGVAPLVAVGVIAWLVFTEIGKDNSFSQKNATHLRVMSYVAAADALVWFVAFLILMVIGAPGIGILFGTVIAFIAAMVIAIAAAALSHLTHKAARLKSENDLTI